MSAIQLKSGGHQIAGVVLHAFQYYLITLHIDCMDRIHVQIKPWFTEIFEQKPWAVQASPPGPMATAVLRASACCIEIHKRLHMFETGGCSGTGMAGALDSDPALCFGMSYVWKQKVGELWNWHCPKTQPIHNSNIFPWKQRSRWVTLGPVMCSWGVDDVRLCLHIGVGCGEISILQVRQICSKRNPDLMAERINKDIG